MLRKRDQHVSRELRLCYCPVIFPSSLRNIRELRSNYYFSTLIVTSILTMSALPLSLAATNCFDSPSLRRMEFV